ncbi:SRPBCC domain-containing protein [Candidatus Gracilibacteria bacterium]|nr:SRPBCC domain-containing protein [Candidatus Gracilibacteria bacterium]NJS41592.1 SRPBCC domain-containing protein [Candidatus Gracilibacteria bacterium]
MKHTIQGKKLTLERDFSAPRQKVWNAFTQQELFVKWWGPRGWETEVKEFNFVEGGVNHYGMKCVDKNQGEWFGQYSWGKMIFSNIQPIDSFEYQDVFSDEDGKVDSKLPTSNTKIEFVEKGGVTKIISITEFADEESLKTVIDMGMLPGITETWDRLDEMVSE